MLTFNAADFTFLCFHLEQLQGDCLIDPTSPSAAAEEREWMDGVRTRMQGVKFYAKQIGLDATAAQAARIEKMAEPGMVIGTLCYLLRDLEGTIVGELKKSRFLMLRTDLCEFLDPPNTNPFGDAVGRAFPKAAHDISEARTCFALERWNACVHHLMLATEQAIRKWAKDLKLRTRLPHDLENIEQLLQAAGKKYEEIKQRKKSRSRDRDLKYVAESSAHFGFIKDAWRNHSAHGRERYDERQAKHLLLHLEAFLRLLSSRKTPIS